MAYTVLIHQWGGWVGGKLDVGDGQSSYASTSAIWLFGQEDLEEKDPSLIQLITRLFVEQPLLHPVC